MFNELKSEIENLLGINVYPLIGPQTEADFVTLQLVSDPNIESGTIRTRLVAARFQLSFISSAYRNNEERDNRLWTLWRDITHGSVGGYPVQYVERGGLSESFDADDGGKYRRARDYIFYCPEVAT